MPTAGSSRLSGEQPTTRQSYHFRPRRRGPQPSSSGVSGSLAGCCCRFAGSRAGSVTEPRLQGRCPLFVPGRIWGSPERPPLARARTGRGCTGCDRVPSQWMPRSALLANRVCYHLQPMGLSPLRVLGRAEGGAVLWGPCPGGVKAFPVRVCSTLLTLLPHPP